MTKAKQIIAWLLAIPVITGVVFIALNHIFHQEPADEFLQTGNVPKLLQSVKQLEKTLAHNPQQSDKQLELAHCYEVMGRYPEAITLYGKAWARVQQSPDELTRFADVLARNKGNSYAGKPMELLTQALQLDNRHIDALIAYATALIAENQDAQATEYLQRAYDLLDSDDLRRSELADVIEKIRDKLK